jgi:hypothetical protein
MEELCLDKSGPAPTTAPPNRPGGISGLDNCQAPHAHHPAFIINAEQLAASLVARFSPASATGVILVWDAVCQPDVSQMLHLSSTHVMLSLPGSVMMNTIFLSNGALLIVPCRRVHPAMNSELRESSGFQTWTHAEEVALWSKARSMFLGCE